MKAENKNKKKDNNTSIVNQTDNNKFSKGGEQVVFQQSVSFSSPIPPPQILQSYEDINPGLADRIIKMAEKESQHRHEMEKKMLDADIELNKTSLAHSAREVMTGQCLGFAIGVIAITSGVFTVYIGHPVSGTFFGTGGVIGLVTAFIHGRKNIEKQQQITKTEEKTSP